MSKKVFYLLVIPLTLIANYYIIHESLTCACVKDFIKQVFNTDSLVQLEAKATLLSQIGFYLGVYLFAMVFLVMNYRVTTGRQPIENRDGPFAAALNRIIGNTIEQSFMFIGFYCYWLFKVYGSDDSKLQEAILYPFLFLTGRVLFALGYVIGVIINFSPARSVGFSLGIAVLVILIGESNGIQVLKYFA